MNTYKQALAALNPAQKEAVQTIDGPVLVIAGPGTGKTQLLAVRAAHILETTDTLPQNILCLTFTESGAANMRERLSQFIGQAAYDITISTYHAFGGELLRRFPEAFAETRLQSPADELTQHQVVRTIVDKLTYDNPLKQLQYHIRDLISTLSEVKRALLNAGSLRAIATENQTFITAATQDASQIFEGVGLLPRTLPKAAPYFEQLLNGLQKHRPALPAHQGFGSLASIATSELAQALQQAQETNKTTPLTAWKNRWLAKDTNNRFVFDGQLQNNRIRALADVFERYQAALEAQGLYDFDDMILRAIDVLKSHPEIRYTLQEQYLYLMLDEFQDTNAAQARLVHLLSDNPVHEGRPNVLAVGDDDQAIYAFQGAQYSNMLDFYNTYRDVRVIHLTENYRSTPDILTTAHRVAEQIEARLVSHFPGMSKTLRAASPLPAMATLERREFKSNIAQYDWIARRIHALIQEGAKPGNIAVLAPKHRQLEPLVPYLASLDVPVRYEKRENILESPVVRQLLTMSKLVLALQEQNQPAANTLWPAVLSYEWWGIPTSTIWRTAWQINDAPRDQHQTWAKMLLASDDPILHTPALLLLAIASRTQTEDCAHLLDYLIGTTPIDPQEPGGTPLRSPLRAYYLGPEGQRQNPGLFYETISHLTVLQARLRSYATAQNKLFMLNDLIAFVQMYESAGERMQSTSPYNQQADAVQLMTVFKAKGLEFNYVFLPSCQDDVWGASSRGSSNKLTLPANLAPIRHAGATDDERLRLLFVAITRARHHLYISSFASDFAGKAAKRLKFLDEQEQPDGSFKSLVLPEPVQAVLATDHQAPPLKSLEYTWQQQHITARLDASLHSLLRERLKNYQLSPTHLTRFIDLEYGGPEAFFLGTLLRFPEAPTVNSTFGNAIHETLEWVQHATDQTGKPPGIGPILQRFDTVLRAARLDSEQHALQAQRAEHALRSFMAQRGHTFRPNDRAEHNFKNEAVFIDNAHLSGKVDKLEINSNTKAITVVDYKTGHSHSRWSSDRRLHKYQLQLYCYKLLIEGSRTFGGHTVTKGRIEFVEPDPEGSIHALELTFNDAETARVRALIQALWQHIQNLDFPDTKNYPPGLPGIRQFETDLINSP